MFDSDSELDAVLTVLASPVPYPQPSYPLLPSARGFVPAQSNPPSTNIKTIILEEEIVYAEIETVSTRMKNDKDIVIISDGALFLICREVIARKYNEQFYPIDPEVERMYMLFRRGKTRVISYSPYAYDPEDFIQL
ncbi:hypothetical protein [Sanyastnella coralliicola]|uniref:hypothetical protein n=1 Tax=Sanyastnella coralliicola TaxID=3069118 RepID=UPI0027B8FF85|nr:hypothetical protein [Longitalea sp. SCSIO 12813]